MVKSGSAVLKKEASLELIADTEETSLVLGRRQTYPIDISQETITIGRAVDNDIWMDLDSAAGDTISRYHAVLKMSKGILYIEDNKSKNGTLVNGQKITEAIPLKDGDKIGLGRKVILKYHANFIESQ